jgi:hypothetical protein
MTESTTVDVLDNKPWWPVGLCTEAYFRRLVAAAETAYLHNGKERLPDLKQIVSFMGGKPTEAKIIKCLGTTEFKAAMSARGILWSGKALGITPEQSYALAIMTDPSLSRLGFNTRLKSAGVTYHKWQMWMREPLFSTAFQNYTETNLKDSVGIAHTALIGKAAEGDMRAIEYLHQITGRFDPQREANMNMNAILLSIIEVLTRRITDPVLLAVIGEDLENIISGPRPSNVIEATVVEDEPKVEATVPEFLTGKSAFSL